MAIQICQWEKGPLVTANWPVQFRSAAKRQQASAAAIKATGVSKAAKASARRRLRSGSFFWIRGPCFRRILMTIVPVKFILAGDYPDAATTQPGLRYSVWRHSS